MTTSLNFSDLRRYLAQHVDTATEREAQLARAAANCAATIALLERTEARHGLVCQLVGVAA
jgi:hypothetical protein